MVEFTQQRKWMSSGKTSVTLREEGPCKPYAFHKAKYKNLGWDNLKYQYRLGDKWN